jgi:hypothetical protein
MARRVIRLKMFLVHDEVPFGLRVVIGTHVINGRAMRIERREVRNGFRICVEGRPPRL